MLSKTIKFIAWALVFLMAFDAWLFLDLKIRLATYILLVCLFILYIIIRFFTVKVEKLEKKVIGLTHILEKSEEKRISAEELKNKITLMIDDLPEGVLIIDKDNKVSVINSKAEKLLGIHKKRVINKPVLEISRFSNVSKIISPIVSNFIGGFGGYFQQEIELKKNVFLDLVIESLVLGKNNIAKLVILNDITKLKNAELSKKQFVSLVSHQLKSPLSAVGLSLKMLANHDFGKVTKEQKGIIQKTIKKNESLIYLVEDLLKEAEVNETNSFNNKSKVNLEELISFVVDFYKDEISAKKISFKFNKPVGKISDVFCDKEKIKMVIQNLLDNAIKYTPVKGKIEINLTPKDEEIEFSIKDSGIGIPEGQKEKIFERFSRAFNAIETKTNGSGLGLAISKDIITKHNGKIWFQSKENVGSIFFFSLPFSGE